MQAVRALALAILLGPAAVAATEIVVGQVAPLSGLEAVQGRAYAAGMQLLFDSVNKATEKGPTFRIVSKDDGGNPQETVRLTRQLLAFGRRQVLKPQPMDLNRVVTDMQRLLRRLMLRFGGLQVRDCVD